MTELCPIPEPLEIKPSPIHGLGIFTKRLLHAGDCLGLYEGEAITKQEFRRRYGNDLRYVYWTRHNFKNTLVYVAKEKRNFITYINENIENPNVCLKSRKLYALHSIKEGSELFLRYDAHYPRDY